MAMVNTSSNSPAPSTAGQVPPAHCGNGQTGRPICPVCTGPLFEIRAKWQCARCHTICETCCEGARG